MNKTAGQYAGMPFGGSKTNNNTTSSSSSKGSGFASAEKKEINTRIDSLVKNLIIQVPSMDMSKAKIKQMINEALVGAVRDFEVTI